MKDLRVVFMGTPNFAYNVLKDLIDTTNVVMVVCQPDREKDRKGNIIYPPCKELALLNNIPVFQPLKIKEDYQDILDIKPDIIITCAYGQILPKELLELPKYGCINVHASLLPKLRGGAPIHHAIMDGYKETGVTIMYMDDHMDSGDIISSEKLSIDEEITLDELYNKLSILGSNLLVKTLPSIINSTNKRIKQDNYEVTFGYNITKEEEHIDFHNTVSDIHNKIRGLSSIPGAYCYLKNKRIKIYRSIKTDTVSNKEPGTIINIDKNGILVSTKDYNIYLTEVKIEGGKRCFVKDIINGIHIEDLKGVVLK